MNPITALNTYKNVGIESGVAAADPHKLILMLYQGALLAIASAKNQILRKEISAKGSSISKAIKIIDEGLKACLDVEAGGEIGKNLYKLYDYMNQRLLIAKGAWESIRPAAPSVLADELLQIAKPSAEKAKQESAPPSAAGKQAVLMYGRM